MFAFPAAGGRLRVQTASLRDLVGWAFDVLPTQVIGGPRWVSSALFNIDAIADVAPQSASEAERETPKRMEALLKERFHLDVHRETRTQPSYALVLAHKDGRLGPGMKFASDCEEVDYSAGVPVPDVSKGLPSWCGSMFGYQGRFHGAKVAMPAFARQLSRILGMPVSNETGLNGSFDLDYDYSPAAQRARLSMTATIVEGKTLFDALKEQLGLRLEARRSEVRVVVVDHADPPDVN
jgi:uncharacterized protein (TIGR03435 family)